MKKEIQKVKEIRKLREQLKALNEEYDKGTKEEEKLKIKLERLAIRINNSEFDLSKLLNSL